MSRLLKFRAFPVWNSDGELKWLEELAGRGYRLVKSWNPVYLFERTEPESVRYCHGFGRIKSKDRNDYFQLYADAGWEHVSSWVGWHYFKSSVATASDADRVTITRNNAKFLKSMALIYLLMIILVSLWVGFSWIRGGYWQTVMLLAGTINIVAFAFGYWLLSYAAKRQLANAERIEIN
jgi:hypothetical protein